MHSSRFRRSTLAAVALVLASLVLALPNAASAAQAGVVTDQSWWPGAADQERTKSALSDVGSRWVRYCVGWRDYEYAKGSYASAAVAQVDTAVDKAVEAGQKIVMCVHETPGWANGSGPATKPPSNAGDYGDFVRHLAARYRGRVQAYEIWNEQNESRFWTGTNLEYATLLKAAYPKIKEADPNATVAFGGLAAFNGNAFDFVQSAYANGVKGSFDVMAWHPYTYNANSPEAVRTDSSGRVTSDSFTGYRRLRSLMAAEGDAKPIYLTEFGWSTTTQVFDPTDFSPWNSGVTEAVQAEYLTRAFTLLEQDPYVEVATWYNFRNNFWAADADALEDRFGLLRTDFTPKPAYSAFKSYAARSAPPRAVPSAAPAATPITPPAATPVAPAAPTTSVRPRRRLRRARVPATRMPSLRRALSPLPRLRGSHAHTQTRGDRSLSRSALR